jgi:hypothetical protein
MNKKWKVVLLALITASVLSMALAAQEPPSPESNAAKATAGLFGTDVDNFFSLHDWGDLEIEKSFVYGGFRQSDSFPNSGYVLDAGYARYFGGLYLGAFYEGRIVDEGEIVTKDQTKTTYGYKNGIIEETKNETEIVNGDSVNSDNINPPEFANNIGVLAGIGSMGIKLGFYESLESTDKYTTDIFPDGTSEVDGNAAKITEERVGKKTVDYDITDYNYSKGFLHPYLDWGIKLNLGNLVIKPEVSAGLVIQIEEEKFSFIANPKDGSNNSIVSGAVSNITENGIDVGTHTNGDMYKDNGYLELRGVIGAGVDFPAHDNRQFGLGLSYGIAPKLYSRSYETASGDETVAGTVSALNYTQTTRDNTNGLDKAVTGSIVTATERSDIGHTIRPSFWYVNELSDQVSVGIKGEIDLSLNSESEHATKTTTTRTVQTAHDGDPAKAYTETSIKTEADSVVPTETTKISVTPTIGTGLSWAVKPGRFTLNAGISVALPTYKSVTTHTLPKEATIVKTDKDYKDGRKEVTVTITDFGVAGGEKVESTTVKETWTALAAGWSLGGTFNFTPNFAVDMYFDSPSDALDNDATAAVNLTAIKFSLLFSLKY